ncbi:MAG: preprotein translocase subunit YajC [Steroidobacteraceae bacterium]
MDSLIATAQAQVAGGPPGGSFWTGIFPMLLIFVVVYFLRIRPQAKRAKEHKALVSTLGVGDEVVTSGGILGRVTEPGDQCLTVEIANGVNVKVQRHTVTSVLPKGTLKSA